MDAIIKKIILFEDSGEWKGQCAIKIREALEATNSVNISGNFVNRAGKILLDPLATPDLLAGINYPACVKYCGHNQLSTVFNYEIFSAGINNYFLPWIALTAQLPFETGENDVLANVMSFCYAVGSPMLITYALATTILNQHWLREKFLKLEASDRPLHSTSKNVRIFLQENQQLPLRLSQEDGSLASLIVLSDNIDWWEKLKTSILLTRRGVTLSLIAQILVAALSWVLTIISSFVSSLGNASEALALSAGCLWVWLWPRGGVNFGQGDLKGDVLALSRYCGLASRNAMGPEQINEYPHWSQLDSEFYQRMVIAVIIAVYVQWGTTGAGIIIAYLTEVTGLGCRSGGYLLYGAVATAAFFCLFISSIFSHAAMLRHQELQVDRIHTLQRGTIASPGSGRAFGRGSTHGRKLALGHSALRFCAVFTRMLGRTLALGNALWIILSTIWELAGFYDNCWCDSTYISKRAAGWVLLFVEKDDMAHAAATSWAGGVLLSIFVGATTCGVFWLYCRGSHT
ncbi:hypothetical protein ONZ43_g3754 [Nemania bipapillata]|uniref:Uncharacterized protein n=1 Tax=Nemania bipapillata TaxID=110536 RepID=A0ACC2IVR5_9PEZI|nr:hypothetical protein ONZ43_g3754 [Nemania bipapillata]